MSFLSGLGHTLKKGVGALGDVAKFAAPIAGMIPGIGTIGGAALGALGTGASEFGHGQKFNLGDIIKHGAMGAAGGLAGKAFSGAGGAGGIGGKLGSLFGGGGGLGSLLGGGGGSGQGGGFNLGKLGQLGLAGLDTAQSAQQQAQAEKLRQSALGTVQGQQGDRDAARKQLMGRLGQVPQKQNLGSLFAGSQNPLQRAA